MESVEATREFVEVLMLIDLEELKTLILDRPDVAGVSIITNDDLEGLEAIYAAV